jgi:hypothetical protein
MRRFKHFVGALIVLAAIGFVIGLYLGWFHFSTSNDPENGRYVISLEVNKGKLVGDTEAAKGKVENMTGSLGTTKVAKGKLVKVDEADRQFSISEQDNKEMEFQVPASSKVRLKDLQAGDEVTVHYTVNEDKNQAQTITVSWGS